MFVNEHRRPGAVQQFSHIRSRIQVFKNPLVRPSDDNQVGILFLGGFDDLGYQPADHDITADLHSLFKKIFSPVNKADIGFFPQPDLFIFLVALSSAHRHQLSFDYVYKNNMLQRAFSQGQQRPDRIEAQLFKLGYKK